jgi:hypothetical protein
VNACGVGAAVQTSDVGRLTPRVDFPTAHADRGRVVLGIFKGLRSATELTDEEIYSRGPKGLEQMFVHSIPVDWASRTMADLVLTWNFNRLVYFEETGPVRER